MKKTLPFLCAALLMSSFASATTASKSVVIDPSRQRVVSYADLDLDNARDAKKFYQRVRTAAHAVCWMPGILQAIATVEMHRCVQKSTKRAIAEVDAPGLKHCKTCTFVARVNE
jgi:UrcA family protein